MAYELTRTPSLFWRTLGPLKVLGVIPSLSIFCGSIEDESP
jgi:hypothetical protein